MSVTKEVAGRSRHAELTMASGGKDVGLLPDGLQRFRDALTTVFGPGEEVPIWKAAEASGLNHSQTAQFIKRLRAANQWPFAGKASSAKLTARQSAILEFIKKFRGKHGIPPTVREIGVQFDIKSPNGVICHLNALLFKGALKLAGHNVSRGYIPTDDGTPTCSCCGRPMPSVADQ